MRRVIHITKLKRAHTPKHLLGHVSAADGSEAFLGTLSEILNARSTLNDILCRSVVSSVVAGHQ